VIFSFAAVFHPISSVAVFHRYFSSNLFSPLQYSSVFPPLQYSSVISPTNFTPASYFSSSNIPIMDAFVAAITMNNDNSSSPTSSLNALVSSNNVVMTATIVSATKTVIIPLSNTRQVINLKLTNTNDLFWRIQMKPYLIGQGVFSFIDGSTICHFPHNDVSATEITNKFGFSQAFLAWKQ
jgi:hypothetical protein